MSGPAPARWYDLRIRVLSAGAMIGIGAVGVWLGGVSFAALVILLTAGMVWEVARLTAPAQRENAVALGLIAAAALLLTLRSPPGLAAAFVLVPALAMALTPRRDRRLAAGWAAAAMVAGFGLITLRQADGTPVILWLILVVVASDVMGYFVGRTLGGPKFWPRVSPKKTWSGTVAGWLGAGLVGWIFVAILNASPQIVGLSIAMSMAAQMGDISESAIKRKVGVKDASNLIPGHGGLLDRFDGLLGAAVLLLVVEQMVDFPPLGQ